MLLRTGFPVNVFMAGIAGLLAWVISKGVIKQSQSRIMTHDEGISAITAMGEKISIPWSLLTHAGLYPFGKSGDALFIYAESTDQLLTIPRDYEPYDKLLEEVGSRIELSSVELEVGQTLGAYLKSQLSTDTESTPLE